MPELPVVVGAAVLRHGCVLAARRNYPAEFAGGWEFPGGKVEPGESDDQAVVREVAEELGCEVVVTGWLDVEAPIGETHVLRVAVTRLATGEPRVGPDHDELRWLTPEALDDVAWLPADRPFLPPLRELLLDGEELPGGNVGGAVRIGDTVRRTTGPWTPAVHALLHHLHDHGLRATPAVQGVDSRGREVLDFMPGEVVDVDHDVLSEARLTDLARWTRELHDATADFDHPGPWRYFAIPGAELVAHNDVATYNACFVGDEVSGVFDWDLAGPSTRLFELAHLAWTAVPLFRPVDAEAVAHRTELIAAAYDGPSAREILHAVGPLKRIGIAGIARWVAEGDPAGMAQAAIGEPGNTERSLRAFLDRLPEVEAALPHP